MYTIRLVYGLAGTFSTGCLQIDVLSRDDNGFIAKILISGRVDALTSGAADHRAA